MATDRLYIYIYIYIYLYIYGTYRPMVKTDVGFSSFYLYFFVVVVVVGGVAGDRSVVVV